VSRELLVHVVKRVIRDAQSSQHLLSSGFALALFLALMPCSRAASDGSKYEACRKLLPQ
jgi:hypothetical protein